MKQILVSYSGCTLIEQLFCDFDDELSQIDSSNIFRREPQKLLLVHKVEASVLGWYLPLLRRHELIVAKQSQIAA